MYESVLGRQIPLPIHTSNTYNVTSYWNTLFKTTGNYTVYWEYHNGTGILSPYSYADIAAYTSLEMNKRGNTTGTQEMLSVLSTMWDGKGMVDEPFKTGPGVYQTYKDALYLLVLTRLSIAIPAGLLDSILRMQGDNGGFHTGYSPELTYAGTDENAETTSIAILALTEQQPSTCSTLCLSVVLGGAIILLLVLTANRRRIEKSERPKISPAQLSSPGMTESRESNEKTILNQNQPIPRPSLFLRRTISLVSHQTLL